MIKIKRTTGFLFFMLIMVTAISNSQNQKSSNRDLETTITYHDSIFWKGYNSCNLDVMANYISNDLEFYHDKSGLTKGSKTFLEISKKNLCNSTKNWRLRREAVKGSVNIYSINNYGAIITGEHIFYVIKNNEPEYLDGIAKFTHVWHLKDDIWKMTRVLSYDHKSASQNMDKTEIKLSKTILETFIGEYSAPNFGPVIINTKEHSLQIKSHDMVITAYPQTKSLFFSKQAPLTFEFVKGQKENSIKMIVREKGKIVQEVLKK